VFGSNWCTRQDQPPWRAAWIQTTGEFVVVHLAGDREGDHGPVRLLGTFADLAKVETALRGWPGVAGWAGSLAWLEHRIAETVTRS